jgi:glycosyltransferase involved in cell wall biosynthesis
VAAHGGLAEIVIDGVNGWHFAPNDPDALAMQITKAITSPESVRAFGWAGRARYQSLFSAALIDQQFRWILHQRTATVG